MLVDGGAVIYESAIINEYLEEKYPDVPLMPRDVSQRARARLWIDFCNSRVHGATHEIVHGSEPDKAKVELKRHFASLDREMAGKDFLAYGYSLADITFIPVFLRQQRYGVPIDDSLPHLKRWMERLLARPGVKSTL